MGKRYVSVGESVTMTVGFSEVACHLRIAGTVQTVTLLDRGMVQVWRLDGSPLSFPITAGEAGIYSDARGAYIAEG